VAQPQSHLKSATWFTIIGIIAAITHYVVAVLLEGLQILPAIYANIAGFLLAFPVSFFGHSAFSFPSEKSSNRLTAVRFFAVAVLGFIANQSLIVLNLMSFDLPFWFVLGIAMFIVAISTYLLSRYWAFKVG